MCDIINYEIRILLKHEGPAHYARFTSHVIQNQDSVEDEAFGNAHNVRTLPALLIPSIRSKQPIEKISEYFSRGSFPS